MYEIVIDSEQFKGKRLLQQHRLVNEVGSGGIPTLSILLATPPSTD